MLTCIIPSGILHSTVVPATIFRHDQAILRVQEEHIALHATDKLREAWVDVTLAYEGFESIKADLSHVYLPPDKIDQFTALVSAQTQTKLTVTDENEIRELHLDAHDVSYTTSLNEPRYYPSIPGDTELNTPVTVSIPGDALNSAIALANDIATHMTLGVDTTTAEFYAVAQGDADSVQATVAPEDDRDIKATDVQVIFSLEYLTLIQQTLPDDKPVQLMLDNNAPALLQYSFAGGNGKVVYRLQQSVVSQDF